MSSLKLLNKIKEYKKICIYKHVNPDGDCVFCSLALYTFLKDNFKDKQIKIFGTEEFDLIKINQKVNDSFIKDSLAISLDTATANRVDNYKCFASKYIVKIDHHPALDKFGDLNIIDPKSASTCELLAEILLSNTFKTYKLSEKTCKYLYCGMLTDTINFRTTNTTAKTLQIAAKLIEKGNFTPSDLSQYVMDYSLDSFILRSKIRNYFKNNKHFGYIKLNKKDIKTLKSTPRKLKSFVDEIGSIRELNIWCIAVEDSNGWACSIRSKKEYIVNTIAKDFNGGGHSNASAVKDLSNAQINKLLKELNNIANK